MTQFAVHSLQLVLYRAAVLFLCLRILLLVSRPYNPSHLWWNTFRYSWCYTAVRIASDTSFHTHLALLLGNILALFFMLFFPYICIHLLSVPLLAVLLLAVHLFYVDLLTPNIIAPGVFSSLLHQTLSPDLCLAPGLYLPDIYYMYTLYSFISLNLISCLRIVSDISIWV